MRRLFAAILFVATSTFLAAPSGAQVWKKITIDVLSRDSRFGSDLAIVGNQLLVAAPGDTTNGQDAGAVITYDFLNRQLPIHQKILPVSGRERARFGSTFEAEGNHLLVSEILQSAIHYFRLESDRYVAISKLTVPHVGASKLFGDPLELNGNWLFVGARDTKINTHRPPRRYSVFLFQFVNGIWEYHSTIVLDDWRSTRNFGGRLCSSGNSLFVSAPLDDQAAEQGGAVYIYELINGAWIFQSKLTAPRAERNDWFGYRIACAENELVVYSEGGRKTYAFKKRLGVWTDAPSRVIVPDADHRYLLNVVLDDDLLYVTRWEHVERLVNAGVVYVFVRDGESWAFDRKFSSPNPIHEDGFGTSIVSTADLIVVGAMYENRFLEDGTQIGDQTGAVYLAKREGLLPKAHNQLITRHSSSGFNLVYPNPAEDVGFLRYEVADRAPVTIELYDVLGRPIRTVLQTVKDPGWYTETIDVSTLPSGVYFYRISIGRLSATKPLTVVH